jgi:hypothetical protein
MDDTERKLEKDTIIAVCALLVSTLAAVSSIATAIIMMRQTSVIARQLSSTVWPYVAIGADLQNTRAAFRADNDGLGPAIVHAVVVRIDGKPQRHFSDAIVRLLEMLSRSQPSRHAGWQFSNADVLRPGQIVTLMEIDSPSAATLIAQQFNHLDIEMCYCSLLDQCWVTGSQVTTSRAVTSCDDDAKIAVRPEDPKALERKLSVLRM